LPSTSAAALLPIPRDFTFTGGTFELVRGATILGDPELTAGVRKALAVADLVPGGPAVPGADAAVRVVRDPGLPAEAYTLTVSADRIEIAAADHAGAFYAAQTLRQTLPGDAFRAESAATAWTVPRLRVSDAPAYGWRGAHLDVARHFLPKRDVLRMIDLLAAHKLNRLHLHLADDQGWRVESRAFPRLHEIGSHRSRTVISHYGEEPVYDETPHGGYYTAADLAEIAAYARARAVTIVPEIDVPGHASAILAAYPEYGPDPTRRYEVLDRWGISPAILSPLPGTVRFLAEIFDELLAALGGAPYVHIGGDECVLDAWAASAEITAYRRTLGLETPADLHAWFLRRLADILAEQGARAVVWDEAFVSGTLRPDTIVMPWRGMGVARRAAAAGYDVVMTPVVPLYFDYAEAASEEEPLAIGEAITVADVAAFHPAPDAWTPQERARVLGAQFQLWTERIPDGRTLDYRAWPRGCALADVVWSGAGAPDLMPRLRGHLARLDAMGVEYRPLEGPRPWQRGGRGWRRHRPGVVDTAVVAARLDELTRDPDSTRPSL